MDHCVSGKRMYSNQEVAEDALIEFELEPGFEGPPPHSHDDQVDSFYVLEGEAEFLVEGEKDADKKNGAATRNQKTKEFFADSKVDFYFISGLRQGRIKGCCLTLT